jgi:alpha-galactosidase
MSTKIAIIGAGSAVFSLSLIRDLCLTPNLKGSKVAFMDIDEKRLNAVYNLCRRYAEELGTSLDLEKTTDRREALRDADFVINTALVAGYDRLRGGWDIGRKYGYRIGGSLHIMHDEAFWINFYQYRLFESLVQDIQDMCPDAYLLLVANPVLAGITYLGRKYPDVKMVGLCHGFGGVYHLAEVLGFDREGLTFEIPGVNHFVWLTKAYHNGTDITSRISEFLEKEAAEFWKNSRPSSGVGPAAFDLYKRFGVFPIGDTCTPGGGSWPHWYHTDVETEQRWQEDPEGWWNGYFPHLEENVAQINHAAYNESVRVTDVLPPKFSGELFILMIESIVCDIPRVLTVNIPNDGEYVPGIPHDFAVEIPALVSKRGIQGIRTTRLPEPVIAYALRDRVAPVNVELRAYETGSKDLLRQLILMDPFTHTEQQAEALLEEILALPYHHEMKAHYR